jgi:hypothetical protein
VPAAANYRIGYWAIAHNGSKTADQPSADKLTMEIIAARGESGRSLPLAASSDAAE